MVPGPGICVRCLASIPSMGGLSSPPKTLLSRRPEKVEKQKEGWGGGALAVGVVERQQCGCWGD